MSDPRPRCPYCNSKQTRHTPTKSNIFTAKFTCRGCGRTFEIDHFGSDSHESKGGCLSSIMKIIIFGFVLMIGLFVLIAMDRKDEEKVKSTNQETINTQESSDDIQSIENAVEIERFEQAAHEYIPTEEDYKKLEQTQNVQKSDNLTIVETTRGSE